MVKVKLRVPLSSAPRETSSPLANPNPLRSAPDYSDDEDVATPQRHGSALVGDNDRDDEELASEDEELELDEDDEDGEEADELDELEEEEDEASAAANASTSTPTKRRTITLKSRSSHGGPNSSSASPSLDGSASPHSGASKMGKRPNFARMAQAQALTAEELDALPAAKRRKTAKARGAAGPGRGWRKGLTKGQKPVYELPPAERTPATFGNTPAPASALGSARASPSAVKAETTPTPVAAATPTLPKPKFATPMTATASSSSTLPSRPSTTNAASGAGGASSSIKIVSGPGGHTFTGDLSAKAGTAKNPGFRYPPLPSSRAGPPVQPIARIPTSFQSVIPLEKNARQPRRWLRAKREILSMGGRPWSIPVFYGGEDRGYEKKVDAPTTTATGANTAGANAAGEKAAGGATADKIVSKAGTPSAKGVSPAPPAAAATTPSSGGANSATPGPKVSASAASAVPGTPASGETPSANVKGGSPLPPPKHLGGLNTQNEANWRGQSPAFLFGGR